MVRKGRLSGNDPFASESNGTRSVHDADANLFGAADAGRMSVRPVIIFDIYPDPTQPRRAMPSVVRQQWDGQPNSLAELFTAWIRLVEEERGSTFDLEAYLTDGAGAVEEVALAEDEPKIGPFEAGLLPIVQLAGSILRDGLVNPITVVQKGTRYLLETGERRWLAFHLLYAYTQDPQWSKISAHFVPDFDRFRQVAENTIRQDLNAIARARQYALLLMAMNTDYEPIPYVTDQAFYAQVLDLNVPYGERDKLLSVLGVTSGSALDRYKQLLRLDTDLWIRGDDENLSERELFRVQNNLEIVPSKPLKRRSVFASKMEDLMGAIQKAKRQDRVRLIDQAISELERLKQNLE